MKIKIWHKTSNAAPEKMVGISSFKCEWLQFCQQEETTCTLKEIYGIKMKNSSEISVIKTNGSAMLFCRKGYQSPL